MSDIIVHNNIFPLQSYFDDTLLDTARRIQPMNETIVAKETEPRARGHFVGLAPTSQTPIAFRALSSRANSMQATPTFILTPGQYMKFEDMSGYEWGLPAGWMGGGIASLVVANSPKAFTHWAAAKTEVLIHRVRLKIQADGAPAGLTFKKAWPMRFPWPSSLPTIAVEPTRVQMRLRESALAAQSDMRLVFKGCDDFDIGSDGTTPGTTIYTHQDVSWPPAIAGISAVAFPILELSGARIGGDISEVALVDISGLGAGGPLVNEYVDISRYGRI